MMMYMPPGLIYYDQVYCVAKRIALCNDALCNPGTCLGIRLRFKEPNEDQPTDQILGGQWVGW